MRLWASGMLVVALAACAPAAKPMPLSKELVFLTRGGCVNTTAMRANLDAALTSMQLPTDYQFIDLDSLAKTDARQGYPTPTVLYRNADLFGMTQPAPPFPEPT